MPDNALTRLALQPDEAAAFWPSSPAAPLRGVTGADYARGAGNTLVALARGLLPPTPNEYMWGMAGYEQPPPGVETAQFDDGRMWQRPPGGEWSPMEQSRLAGLSAFFAPLGVGPAPRGAVASGVPVARTAVRDSRVAAPEVVEAAVAPRPVPLLPGLKVGERQYQSLPVEIVVDPARGVAGPGAVEVLDNGRVRIFRRSAGPLVQDERDWITRAVEARFDPKEDVFYRFTNNENEAALAQRGELRPSVNHTDNVAEAGVSVASSPHYEGQGYRYGYQVRGRVIGVGSDGEPLLDPKTVRAVGRLMPSAEVPLAWQAKRNEALREAGWTEEHYRAAMSPRGYSAEEYSGLLGE